MTTGAGFSDAMGPAPVRGITDVAAIIGGSGCWASAGGRGGAASGGGGRGLDWVADGDDGDSDTGAEGGEGVEEGEGSKTGGGDGVLETPGWPYGFGRAGSLGTGESVRLRVSVDEAESSTTRIESLLMGSGFLRREVFGARGGSVAENRKQGGEDAR